jgi:hypothetical protein
MIGHSGRGVLESGIVRGKKECPACRSKMLHRSQMRGLVERAILRPLGLRAYRCGKCDERFFRFGADGGDSGPKKH